jgi:hypothetical protein
MATHAEMILSEIKKVAQILNKDRFSRDEFLKNSQLPLTRKDIEKEFGSFAEAMKQAGLRPKKHYIVTDDELFRAYETAYKKLGYYPLGHKGEKELEELTSISGYVFRKRYGGTKNFLFEFKNWQNEKNVVLKNVKKENINSEKEITNIDKQAVIESFQNKQRYWGKAGEYFTMAEMLFRGFNISSPNIDEGIDLIAEKNSNRYLIQIKHSSYPATENISGNITITTSSFNKFRKSNVFYIFVLLRKEPIQRQFLIVPYHKLNELIIGGIVNVNGGAKQFSFRVVHTSNDNAYINKVSEKSEVSQYLDAWYNLV